MSRPAEVQEATLQKFITAWEAWSSEGQLAVFTDDIIQRTLPFSLGIPPRTRQQMGDVLPRLEEVVSNYKLTVHHVVHDTRRGLASILATSTGDSALGDWRQEYAVYLRFDETGEKFCKIDEMMDASFLMKFTPVFKQYLAEHPKLNSA